MKITKKEYLRAQRIVMAYERQQQEGKYQFLYWDDDYHSDDDPKVAWIEADSLLSACEKFMRLCGGTVKRIDYEVFFKGEYLDITNFVCVSDYI